MILASAQFKPVEADIEYNLGIHSKLIDQAYSHYASLIVFPEMSLTGYIRELASNYAFTLNDTRLGTLRKQARDYQMTIIAGAPIKVDDKLFIGSFIIQPDNSIDVYIKHFLHGSEKMVFQPSNDFNPILNIEKQKFALAICYDIEVDDHIDRVCNLEVDNYIPSIFYSKKGIQKGHDRLAMVAKKNRMNVLMSNFCGDCYGIKSGGRSAFWNNKGELVEELDEDSQGLLIVEEVYEVWKGTAIFTNYE